MSDIPWSDRRKRGTRPRGYKIDAKREEGDKKRTTTTTKPRAGASGVLMLEEEVVPPRGLTTLGRPRTGLMIEERSRLNDPCPRVLGSPWIGPRFAVESKRASSLPNCWRRRPWESPRFLHRRKRKCAKLSLKLFEMR